MLPVLVAAALVTLLLLATFDLDLPTRGHRHTADGAPGLDAAAARGERAVPSVTLSLTE
jgi:hypothetical protein